MSFDKFRYILAVAVLGGSFLLDAGLERYIAWGVAGFIIIAFAK